MATKTAQASFSPELFSFLAELRANNNRDWFVDNKHRYEEYLLEPVLEFICRVRAETREDQPSLPARAGQGRAGTRFLPAPRPRRGVRRRGDLASGDNRRDADPRSDRRRPRALAARDPDGRLREAPRAGR